MKDVALPRLPAEWFRDEVLSLSPTTSLALLFAITRAGGPEDLGRTVSPRAKVTANELR